MRTLHSQLDPQDLDSLLDLGRALDARALGLWQRHLDHLDLAAFLHTSDLPADVAAAFTAATARVPLQRTDLSIAQAAASSSFIEARADQLPPDTGSGYWLRQFAAARSIAVPVPGGVLSVAVPPACRAFAHEIAERLRAALPVDPFSHPPGRRLPTPRQ